MVGWEEDLHILLEWLKLLHIIDTINGIAFGFRVLEERQKLVLEINLWQAKEFSTVCVFHWGSVQFNSQYALHTKFPWVEVFKLGQTMTKPCWSFKLNTSARIYDYQPLGLLTFFFEITMILASKSNFHTYEAASKCNGGRKTPWNEDDSYTLLSAFQLRPYRHCSRMTDHFMALSVTNQKGPAEKKNWNGLRQLRLANPLSTSWFFPPNIQNINQKCCNVLEKGSRIKLTQCAHAKSILQICPRRLIFADSGSIVSPQMPEQQKILLSS